MENSYQFEVAWKSPRSFANGNSKLLRRGKECGVRPNLISVIAKHRAPLPLRNAERGCPSRSA